jgi:lipopolysaccharide assembly protein A
MLVEHSLKKQEMKADTRRFLNYTKHPDLPMTFNPFIIIQNSAEDSYMKINIIFALLIAIIAVIFALQNITTVRVSFFFWSIEGSLALVLLVTLAVGVLISSLTSLPSVISGKWTTSSQRKKLAKTETERNMYQQKAEAAEKEVKNLEDQLANLSAIVEQNQTDKPSDVS